MNINEIFTSIQGEGPATGVLSKFVRFTGCNLHCSWCDAWYALEQEGKKRNKKISVDQFLDEHVDPASPPNLYILTGGEPAVQPRAEMMDLVASLHSRHKQVHIETNGTHLDRDWMQYLDHVVVSPKTFEKGVDLDGLRSIDLKKVTFKLLFEQRRDGSQGLWTDAALDEFLYAWADVLPDVFVSPVCPEPYDYTQYSANCRAAYDWLVEQGFQFQDCRVRLGLQTHKILWQNEQGR